MSKSPPESPPRRRLVLVRHGEVAADWRRRIYGQLDVPLSANGERQLHAVAERFRDVPFELVASSGLARAEYGARLLREPRGLARRDEPELLEIHRGDWAGRSFDELERDDPGAHTRWLADPGTVRPPNGESLEDLRVRVVRALARLAAEVPGDVAIVAHSWVLRVAACHVLGLALDRAPDLALPTGGALVLDHPAHAPFDAICSRDVRLSGWNPDQAPSP
ncbi:MAG: alpha-ribazole phosphatase family protein [Planctomycetota bacterium]